jgi:hypothetical protein
MSKKNDGTPEEEIVAIPQEEQFIPLEAVDPTFYGPKEPVILVPVLPEVIPEVAFEGEVPAVDFLVDAVRVQEVMDGRIRLPNAFRSLAYLGQGVPEDEIAFVGMLCWMSVKTGGLFYIPVGLSEMPSIVGMDKQPVDGHPDFLMIRKPF